jgi:glycyl-tRNA synthetase beta chain
MSDFVLEVFSEEVPSILQKDSAVNLNKISLEVLRKNGLMFDEKNVKSLVSHRRLVLIIGDLLKEQMVPAIRKIGPKVDSSEQSIKGFLKSFNINEISDLQKITQDNAEYYCFNKEASKVKTDEIIKKSLPQILTKMVNIFPKLMRWDVEGDSIQPKWIRPVRNILSIFDNQIIEFSYFGLFSSNFTFASDLKTKIVITNASEYEKILKENLIIIDQVKRKKIIIDQLNQNVKENELELVEDPEKSTLYDEVSGLCEYPTILSGKIDQKFMSLPEIALISTLKNNQKYFCVRKKGDLSANFLFVANVVIDEKNRQKIINDNEKIVNARLSDIEFFVNEDLKKSLKSRTEELKKVVFHQKLGSIHDKTQRMANFCKSLSLFIPHCKLSSVDLLIDLCKADLTTKLVAEMPELQGKVGSFYAEKQNFDREISSAIYEHYLPIGVNSKLPSTSLGVLLSIADKIDSIVGFFLANEKPTSSKDPYALRRAVLGIIRIILENNILFPLKILIEKSLNCYPPQLQKKLLLSKEGGQQINFYQIRKDLIDEIVKFFIERLKIYLKENEFIKSDIINSVMDNYLLNSDKNSDIFALTKKIRFLNEFIQNKENHNIILLYKRSANILIIEEKKDKKTYQAKPSRLIFKTKYEKLLYRKIKEILPKFRKMINLADFENAFQMLKTLEISLSAFFNHVVVNDDNQDVRENRLLLLSRVRLLFNLVADFSRIEI